jgi:hypothetical protein
VLHKRLMLAVRKSQNDEDIMAINVKALAHYLSISNFDWQK